MIRKYLTKYFPLEGIDFVPYYCISSSLYIRVLMHVQITQLQALLSTCSPCSV